MPWISQRPLALCTVTFGFPSSKKNSFNHMKKYGIWWFDHFLYSEAEICQLFFVAFFKTPKRHSENNWHLKSYCSVRTKLTVQWFKNFFHILFTIIVIINHFVLYMHFQPAALLFIWQIFWCSSLVQRRFCLDSVGTPGHHSLFMPFWFQMSIPFLRGDNKGRSGFRSNFVWEFRKCTSKST